MAHGGSDPPGGQGWAGGRCPSATFFPPVGAQGFVSDLEVRNWGRSSVAGRDQLGRQLCKCPVSWGRAAPAFTPCMAAALPDGRLRASLLSLQSSDFSYLNKKALSRISKVPLWDPQCPHRGSPGCPCRVPRVPVASPAPSWDSTARQCAQLEAARRG